MLVLLDQLGVNPVGFHLAFYSVLEEVLDLKARTERNREIRKGEER